MTSGLRLVAAEARQAGHQRRAAFFGQDDGAAVFHPLHPARFETAAGQGCRERTGEMRAALAPVEARTERCPLALARRSRIDPEPSEERDAGACQPIAAISDGEMTSNLIRLYKALGGGWSVFPTATAAAN